MRENEFVEARRKFTVGLELLQKTNQNVEVYAAYHGLGELARLEGNYPEAIENYLVSLKAVRSGSLNIEVPRILDGIAKTEYLGSKFDKSVRLFGAAEALRNRMGMVIHIVDRPEYDKHIELLRSNMNAGEFESAWEDGAKLSSEEVYEYVMQDW